MTIEAWESAAMMSEEVGSGDGVEVTTKSARLDYEELYRLQKWMEANRGQHRFYTHAANAATDALGFRVSASTMSYIAERIGEFLAPKPVKEDRPKSDVVALAREVAELREQVQAMNVLLTTVRQELTASLDRERERGVEC